MPLRHVLLSIGTFSALAATSLFAGHGTGSSPAAARAEAPSVPLAPTLVADDRVDDAIAAAVISSITRQFDTSDVVVQLGAVRVSPASIQDRQVDGDGRLRIGGRGDWIPFRFAAMYDSASMEVSYPDLKLGGGTVKALPGRSPIAASLARQVASALEAEFQGQQVAWNSGAVRAAELGPYMRLEGRGTADFGAEGSTPALIQGLYDTVAKRWVRVHYEFGPGSDWGNSQRVAML